MCKPESPRTPDNKLMSDKHNVLPREWRRGAAGAGAGAGAGGDDEDWVPPAGQAAWVPPAGQAAWVPRGASARRSSRLRSRGKASSSRAGAAGAAPETKKKRRKVERWHLTVFRTRPFKWMTEGIDTEGDCFFTSVSQALRHDTELPAFVAPTAEQLRADVAASLDAAALEGYEMLAIADPDIEWLDVLRILAGEPRAVRLRMLRDIALDPEVYWGDQFALAKTPALLDIMILLVDARPEMRSTARFTVFSTGRRPRRVIVLKIRKYGNVSHFQPLMDRVAGRGCWTLETLPALLRDRFRAPLARLGFASEGDSDEKK